MSPALYRRLLPARSEQEFACLQSDAVWILSLTCRRLPQRSAAKHALAAARGRGDCSSKAQGLQERAGPAGQSGHPRHASSALSSLLISLCSYDSQAVSLCVSARKGRSGRPPHQMVAGLERRQGFLLRGRLCCSFISSCWRAERQSEPKAKAQEQSAGSFLAGAAVNGLYTGLKFTGLAVRVASGLAASIGKDAEAAMARSREAQQAERGAAEQVHKRITGGP